MAFFEYKGKTFYIDNRLDRSLTKKVYPDLLKHDKDNVFLVDGNEGSGKSKFADILGAHAASHLKCDYDLDCVCLTPEEFKSRIQNCPNRSVVIYDEANRGMSSSRALSEINNILKDLMMEMRQKNLFVIIIMPTFFLLDKYTALFRAKGLFHVYERKRKRGFWVFFNEKNKKKLYILGKKLLDYNIMKYPRFRGVFLNQWSVDEVLYRAKKLRIFKDNGSTEEKPQTITAKKHYEQRNKVVRLLFEFLKERLGFNQAQYIKYLNNLGIGIAKTQIQSIIDGDEWKTQGTSSELVRESPENSENEGVFHFKNQYITYIDKSDGFFPQKEEVLEENAEIIKAHTLQDAQI
jgi:hypothetical protein